MSLRHRLVPRRRIQLLAIAIVLGGATFAALGWRDAVLERRLTRQAVLARLQHAADAGRGAMLQEIARTHDRLRDVMAAPSGVRVAMLAELAGHDAERTAMFLEDRQVTLAPARVLRYLPDPPGGDSSVRAGTLLAAARDEVRRGERARALSAYDELAQMRDVRIRTEPASLIARSERLRLLPRQARSVEAASILRDLESGAWALSRSTYESYRDDLDDFVPGDRDVPLWEEAVHAVSAASRATAGQAGEIVIWVDESRPLLLIWRSGGAAAAALAVTGRYVADRWLPAQPAVGYGIEGADRQPFLPYPPDDPRTERSLRFAGREWRMITFAWPH